MLGKFITIAWGDNTIASTLTDKLSINGETIPIASPSVDKFVSAVAGTIRWSVTTDFLITTSAQFNKIHQVSDSVIITIYDENSRAILAGTASVIKADTTMSRGSVVRGAFEFLGNGPLDAPITGIVLSANRVVMPYSGTRQLYAETYPEYATEESLVWASDNLSVAKVSQSGLITGVSPGNCFITCSSAIFHGAQAVCRVQVTPVAVTDIELSPAELNIHIGGEAELIANVIPSDASDDSVDFSSSDASVATVEQVDYNRCIVTAVGVGTCTIRCAATDGNGVQTSCQCVVDLEPVLVENITISPNELFFNDVGETAQLTALVLPADATNKEVEWYSDDESIVTVDEDGIVTSMGHGHCAVYCKSTDGTEIYSFIPVSA